MPIKIDNEDMPAQYLQSMANATAQTPHKLRELPRMFLAGRFRKEQLQFFYIFLK